VHDLPSGATSRHELLTPTRRTAIERTISVELGRRWQVTSTVDLDALASHPSAILSDGELGVFAKLVAGPHALDQLATELAGLRRLTDLAGVRTPGVVGPGVIEVDGGAVLLLEPIPSVARTPEGWRAVGRMLAAIHRVHADEFGDEANGWFGPLHLDNRPLPGATWAEFYVERRVWPRLVAAIEAGAVPSEVARRVERLVHRIGELAGPDVAPSLLHGDAQQNNFISSPDGPVAIDPAVHFGHPEVDLSIVELFAPVPSELFDGYREVGTIHDGFDDRRDLWRVFAHLAVVTVGGSAHLRPLVDALARYVD